MLFHDNNLSGHNSSVSHHKAARLTICKFIHCGFHFRTVHSERERNTGRWLGQFVRINEFATIL